MDPLFLGRCRVRIHGFHSKFTKPVSESADDQPSMDYIPVDELPWALPVTPITSAAMTGIGDAPVGPVEGTWVFGFFMDGDDMQQPVMVGTVGGVEMKDDEQKPGITTSGTPVPKPETESVKDVPADAPTDEKVQQATDGVLGPLDQGDIDALKAALGKRESSNDYSAVNTLGYVGKYQFGNMALYDLGYSKTTQASSKVLANADAWTGKGGVTSREAFLKNTAAQEECMDGLLRRNYRTLLAKGTITKDSSKSEVAGYLAAAHLKGCGGAAQLKGGSDNSDAYGTSASAYYKLGSSAVGGSNTQPPLPAKDPGIGAPQINTPDRTTSPADAPTSFADSVGFKDPNKIYPKFDDQDKRPDTNYLAYQDHIIKTHIKLKEDQRYEEVEVALDGENWSQPLSPYNATYPYNHVYQSESGHVLEFDDTAGNERINLWHKTGTFQEIDTNGTQVNRIIGDGYWVLDRDGFIRIGGKCNITIDGDANVLVKNNANVEVRGNVNGKFFNDVTSEVSGNFKLSVKEQFDVRAKSMHFEVDDTGEAFTIKSKDDAGKVMIQSKGDITMLAEQAIKLTTGKGKISIRALKTIVAIDGTAVKIQKRLSSKASAISKNLPGDEEMYEPDPRLTPEEPTFPALTTAHWSDRAAFFYDEPGYPPEEIETHVQKQVDSGTYKQNDIEKPVQLDTPDETAPPAPAETPEKCPDGFEMQDSYSPALQLSTSFKLSQVSSSAVVTPTAVVDQHGLRKGAIVCNLRALAKTTLDPIKAKYPNMIITSGFRTASGSSKTSQHELGQAADLQFPGVSKEEYYNIACWIRDNCTYDQLLLEYKTTGTGLPWIHVSCSLNGNRKQVLTLMNHKVIAGTLNRVA